MDTVTSMISQDCQCEAQHSQGSKFIQVSFPFQDVLSYFSCCHPQCPWAQSRFGPWMPCGCRGSGLPQSPPCTERLSEPPAASLSPAVQWRPRHSSGRMSAITQTPGCLCSLVLASESTAKSPQGIPAADRHHSCFTIPATTPHLHWGVHPKELCCVTLHTGFSSAVQPWPSTPHRNKHNPGSAFQQEQHPQSWAQT